MFKFIQKNLIILFAVALVILLSASLIPPLKSPVINILKFPLVFFELTGREIKGLIFYHRNYIENQRLKNETNLLKQRINNVDEIYLENTRLKDLLLLKKNSTFKTIVAAVISRSADNWSSSVVLNKGRRHGIKAGFAVIGYSGLLGRIIEVGESTSRLVLVNDPNLSVSAIDQRSRQEGLVSGTLGSSLIMRYLPKDADIAINDVIVTSGLTQAYPKGLMIGRVSDIGEEFSGLSKYALIKPMTNLSNIEEALIIVE